MSNVENDKPWCLREMVLLLLRHVLAYVLLMAVLLASLSVIWDLQYYRDQIARARDSHGAVEGRRMWYDHRWWVSPVVHWKLRDVPSSARVILDDERKREIIIQETPTGDGVWFTREDRYDR